MVQKITGEVPFQVLATNFSISPSTEGYTLQISADGVNYTDLFAVGANVTRMVTGVANGSYYRLSGNNSTVSVNWRSQCTDGQSGGGGGEGSQGPMGPMGPQGYQGPAGSGEAGDSHILKVSSSAPSGLSEGDVYALHADGSPREIGSDWTDIGEVSYEWSEDYPQAVAIPLNSSEYFSVRFGYTTESEGADNGVIVENGELSMENINGWESDGENSYVLTDDNWMDITSGKTMHVFMDNDVLYLYSDDVEIIWLWTVVEPSDEEHTISTGEITPAVPETMGVYQYNDGTIVELASKDDLPAKINLVPNGEPNYGNILRYNDKPEWVHPSEITNAQLINIETEESAEGSYPQVLKRLNDYDFKWAKQEKRLEAVSALPTTYVEGAVYALANASGYGVYQVQSGTPETTWAHYDENIPTGWTMARVPYTDDTVSELVGLRINNCGKRVNLFWHPEDPNDKHWEGNVSEQNDGEFTTTDTCGNSISCVRDGDYLVLTFDAPVTNVNGTYGHTELYTETIVPNYVKIGEGGGAGGDIVHLDNLDAAGEEGVLYEFNNNYFKYTSASGTWGEWVVTPYDNVAFQGTSYLYYTKLPDSGITLCSTKIINSISWLKYEPENERIDVYDNSSLTGTPVTSVTKNGVAVRLTSSSRWLDVSWVEGKITFYVGYGFAGLVFTCDTDINGGHYEYVANPVANPVVDSSNGAIPKWNSKGQIVGAKWNYAEKPIRINNTGYSNTRKFLSGDGNVQWENWFFPTVGGTQGEVLVSGGESAEPVWTSWIKSVKITSAAYEALATKDPNTLYLIVD